ncbi:MAG: putative 2-hydroxyacid dehydrogenase [Verrucomicrobiaceae bacterium]|nr:putative 2-hydroxyacid dehydrogenase [Verrucomicrobiaceae bacterium]
MKPKVIITDFISEPLTYEREILGDLAEVTALGAEREPELAGRIEEADVVVMYHQLSIGRETIERLKHCRFIVRGGVGVDNVDRVAARERGIDVANVPDYGTEDIADTAIAMMMTLTRGVHFLNSRLRRNEGPWHYRQAAPVWRLRGRVFGLIGIGCIGMATALRAKAMGMDVVFYDPYVPQGLDKALGLRCVSSLEELLRQAHVLSVHCPLNEHTKAMINTNTLALMKPGGFLINTARGGIVDPHAVLAAITGGHLAGAGLDVLPLEPPDPADPLIMAWRDPSHPAHDRLILNPHSAFYTEEGLADMRIKSSHNVRRVLLGEKPWNVVN